MKSYFKRSNTLMVFDVKGLKIVTSIRRAFAGEIGDNFVFLLLGTTDIHQQNNPVDGKRLVVNTENLKLTLDSVADNFKKHLSFYEIIKTSFTSAGLELHQV